MNLHQHFKYVDLDPPPPREKPFGTFENWAGRSTPGKKSYECPLAKRATSQDRDYLLIIAALISGISIKNIVNILHTYAKRVRMIRDSYLIGYDIIEDKKLNIKLASLSKTQQRILFAIETARVGLSVKHIGSIMKIDRELIYRRLRMDAEESKLIKQQHMDDARLELENLYPKIMEIYATQPVPFSRLKNTPELQIMAETIKDMIKSHIDVEFIESQIILILSRASKKGLLPKKIVRAKRRPRKTIEERLGNMNPTYRG